MQEGESMPDTGLTVTEMPMEATAVADARAGAKQKHASTDAHKSHA